MNHILLIVAAVLGLLLLVGLVLAILFPAAMRELKDALLKVTSALPGASTNVTCTAIDTGKVNSIGGAEQGGGVEYKLTAPALTVAQLLDAATMTYDVVVGTTTSPATA